MKINYMGRHNYRIYLTFWVMNIFLVLAYCFIAKYFYQNINTAEDSILEFIQAGILFVSVLSFGYQAIIAKDVEAKLVSIGLALLVFSFLIRELDVEKFDLPEIVKYFLGTEGKSYTMLLAWGSYFILYFFRLSMMKKRIKVYLLSYEGQLILFAFVLLFFAQLMDRNVFHMLNYSHRFYEEILELLSYIYIIISVFLGMKH